MYIKEIGFGKFDESFEGLERVRCMGKPYTVYVLIDPRDNTVRYVGQTKDPRNRRRSHISMDQAPTNKLISLWKEELHRLGMQIVFKPIDSAEEFEWETVERMYIAYYRSRGRMYNKHKGGMLKKVKLNKSSIVITAADSGSRATKKYVNLRTHRANGDQRSKKEMKQMAARRRRTKEERKLRRAARAEEKLLMKRSAADLERKKNAIPNRVIIRGTDRVLRH